MTRVKRLGAGLVLGALLLGVATPALAQPSKKKKGGEGTEQPQTPSSDERELALAVGENRTIPAKGVKQYTEGTQGVVDVRLTGDSTKFIVVGLKSGSTTLLLINDDGTQTNYVINVFSRPPELVERELTDLLDGYTGLRVKRVGSRLFIEGGVATKADQDKIKQVALLYGGQVESLVSVGTGSIDRKVNVRIDFYFVQYSASSGYGLGVSWPQRIGGQFATSQFGYDFVAKIATAKTTVVNQPLPALDIAANNGWAKVLKQATVITTNGNEASFSSGGEVNVPVTSGFAATIQQITYGTNVRVLPRFDPKTRNVEVKVDANVADLTPSLQTDLPGRSTSELSTLVFLKLGQSLVLSGIKTSTERHAINGVPLLSAIPVLGVLFGSHQNQAEEVEGAVFIVPSVVEAVPLSKFDIVDDALKQYEEFGSTGQSILGDLDDVKPFETKSPAYEEAVEGGEASEGSGSKSPRGSGR